MFTLLPAIDVVEGQAVRLRQGEAGTEKSYGNPLEVAADFAAAGAEWIHLVDLDAAFGRGSNLDLLSQVIAASPLKIELSGGIRNSESLERALNLGATRVNLGTAALEDPEWTAEVIAEYGDKIAVGLDVRGHTLAGRGWTKEGGDLFETIRRLNKAGCERYVITDVTRDGMLEGSNLELLCEVCEHTDANVVASGGVASLDDLRALREMQGVGVEGAIVGKAIYAGRFTLEEAISVAKGEN